MRLGLVWPKQCQGSPAPSAHWVTVRRLPTADIPIASFAYFKVKTSPSDSGLSPHPPRPCRAVASERRLVRVSTSLFTGLDLDLPPPLPSSPLFATFAIFCKISFPFCPKPTSESDPVRLGAIGLDRPRMGTDWPTKPRPLAMTRKEGEELLLPPTLSLQNVKEPAFPVDPG